MAIDLNGSTGISLDDNEKINIGNDSDLQIYHNGSNSYLNNTTGDLTLDVSGDIILDADGTDVRLAKGGVQYGMFTTNSTPLGFYIDALVQDGDLFFRGNDGGSTITAMTIDMSAGGKVGIGTSSPSATLTASQSSNNIFALERTGISGSSGQFGINIESNSQTTVSYDDGAQLVFGTASSPSTHVGFTERMRLDSSGNLLVGMTSASTSNDGAGIRSDGLIHAKRANVVATFNRKTSDGDVVQIAKDNTVVGSLGTGFGGGTHFGIQTYTADLRFKAPNGVVTWDGTQFYPALSAQKNLGHPNHRWEDAWVVNGVTTGSDANDKQDIATLTATEMLVAARLSQTFRTYRWKDKVVEKGDNARTHTGTIAQEVQSAFTAEGLDAGDYAMFMSDTRWEHDVDVPAVEAVAEVTDEDGNVTTEAVEAVDAYTRTDTYDTEDEAPEGATSKTRLGIRYPELLSFVAAYNEQRFASIEARLTALEA